MGECLITRRGGEPYKLPILDENYPQNVTVTSGDNATFHVVFSEQGRPATYTYQWYVNGSLVNGATNSTYIRNTSSDKGQYTVYCEVTSKAGTATSGIATLTVNKVPILNTNYPANVTANVTGSATFNVEVATDGYPTNYTYQWYVNDSAVSGATSYSYTLTNIAKGSHTVYCNVTNSAGTVKSEVATVTASKLYLYNAGDENKAVTGGWVGKTVSTQGANSTVPTLTRNANSLTFTLPENKYGMVCLANKINLSGYNTLRVQGTVKKDPSSPCGWNYRFEVRTDIDDMYTDIAAGTTICNSVDLGHVPFDRTIDISTLNSSYYIAFPCYNSSGRWYGTTITGVWLE